jgi:hypothetical protein
VSGPAKKNDSTEKEQSIQHPHRNYLTFVAERSTSLPQILDPEPRQPTEPEGHEEIEEGQ